MSNPAALNTLSLGALEAGIHSNDLTPSWRNKKRGLFSKNETLLTDSSLKAKDKAKALSEEESVNRVSYLFIFTNLLLYLYQDWSLKRKCWNMIKSVEQILLLGMAGLIGHKLPFERESPLLKDQQVSSDVSVDQQQNWSTEKNSERGSNLFLFILTRRRFKNRRWAKEEGGKEKQTKER